MGGDVTREATPKSPVRTEPHPIARSRTGSAVLRSLFAAGIAVLLAFAVAGLLILPIGRFFAGHSAQWILSPSP
jgi:hypothetical protein